MTANIHPETGLRYGVISGRNAELLHEVITTEGVNETLKEQDEEIREGITSTLKDYLPKEKLDDLLNEIMNQVTDAAISAGADGSEDTYTYTDSDGNQFRCSALGGAPLIWCIKTDTVVHARVCSPCVPNAGDLDNLDENGVACYGVPKRYQDE